MFCFHICQTAFVELFSREVANILQVFDLSCNRAYPHLDKGHTFFLLYHCCDQSKRSFVQGLWWNEPSGSDHSVFLEAERLPHTALTTMRQGAGGKGIPVRGCCLFSSTTETPQIYPTWRHLSVETLFLSLPHYQSIHLSGYWQYLRNTELLLKNNMFHLLDTGKDAAVSLWTGTGLDFERPVFAKFQPELLRS